MTNHGEEATRLLQFSKILSISSSSSVPDAFPAINAIFHTPGFNTPKQWDFFFTTACICTGLAMYTVDHDPSEVRDFAVALLNSTKDYDYSAAIADFQQFMNRTVGCEGVDRTIAMGWWVLWNMKGGVPSDEELEAAPAIGALILNGLQDWNAPSN